MHLAEDPAYEHARAENVAPLVTRLMNGHEASELDCSLAAEIGPHYRGPTRGASSPTAAASSRAAAHVGILTLSAYRPGVS